MRPSSAILAVFLSLGASISEAQEEIDEDICGSIVSLYYNKDKTSCIVVKNLCGQKIHFKVSLQRSSGRTFKLGETVEPGETGKVCGTQESDRLGYEGGHIVGGSRLRDILRDTPVIIYRN